MDWLICIGGGIFIGALMSLPSFFRNLDQTLDEMEKVGAYRRKKW
jgi:hypothetical protein